jgi:nitrite reductase (NADH) small subunit
MTVPFRERKRYNVTDEFLTVCPVDQIPNGSVSVVQIGSFEIGIYHIDGEWYAIDNICPHSGAQLHEGWVHDKTVTCPWHAWCFSLETGRMAAWDREGVARFELKIEDDTVKLNPKPIGGDA